MRYIFVIIFLSFLGASCRNRRVVSDPDVYYTCSMDPQVISDKPGKCPICKMELTAVKKSSVKESDDLQLSDQQIQLGNIHYDTIASGNIADEIVLLGTLNLNGMKTSSISARVMGRIERLYKKNVGEYVSKGVALYEIYSEELNNAKQEYILALQRKKLFTDQGVIDFESIIESGRNKLQLWGLSDQQIKDLENDKKPSITTTYYSNESGYITSIDVSEGGYVMEGGTIIQLADLSSLWAEVQVYATELSKIPIGSTAKVEIPDANMQLNGKIAFANPEFSPGDRVNLVRITIPNPGNKLKPGMSAYVHVNTRNKYTLQLPIDAVIKEHKGASVWIKTGHNTFRSQMVTTGMESEGIVEITQGIKQGDIVVIQGTYLLNSEFIFKRGTDPMSGHTH